MFDDKAHVLLALSAASLARWLASVWSSRVRRSRFVRVGEVSELNLFPVKSCQGIPLQKARAEVTGLESDGLHDRQWMLVRANGDFLSQRHYSRMALVRVSSHRGNIHLDAPEQPTLVLPKNPPVDKSRFMMTRVWGLRVLGMDCGDEAARWFQKYLEAEGVRLVVSSGSMPKKDSSEERKPWENPAQPGDMALFSDFGGYLVMNAASLNALNERLERKVTFRTFRPNIVISGCESFAEDCWDELRIGDTDPMFFRILDPCTRCILTTVNPDTGERNKDRQPLETLKQFRCFPPYGSDPIFGVNAALDNTGTIQVGDPVYALRK
ncbi:mitochondrial amidoxime-reducing component 1-like [Ostrea edulis]|uniref:mitochondrial amidoxime-reducing component 1-like n=1 Tax=Ostrea edulis TaxID=37623 RepID=UPI0020945C95|nr:mitochondrial amidoxime-reducing component 1-like [Ostrea edulis]